MNPRTLSAIAALALLVLALAGCASRPDACDVLDANAAQVTKPVQSVAKWDALTGAALADSDGDAVQSNQRVAVDVQAPNQSTGGNLAISSLTGGAEAAAKILATTSPAEGAVVRQIAANEEAVADVRLRLSQPFEDEAARSAVEGREAALVARGDSLLARLDVYAARKFDAAKAFVPDLSGLRTIVYQITTNTVAGSALPNISDAQGAAIAKVAEAAVTTSQTGGE